MVAEVDPSEATPGWLWDSPAVDFETSSRFAVLVLVFPDGRPPIMAFYSDLLGEQIDMVTNYRRDISADDPDFWSLPQGEMSVIVLADSPTRVSLIADGLPLDVTVDADTPEPRAGLVTSSGSNVDPLTRTWRSELAFTEAAHVLSAEWARFGDSTVAFATQACDYHTPEDGRWASTPTCGGKDPSALGLQLLTGGGVFSLRDFYPNARDPAFLGTAWTVSSVDAANDFEAGLTTAYWPTDCC